MSNYFDLLLVVEMSWKKSGNPDVVPYTAGLVTLICLHAGGTFESKLLVIVVLFLQVVKSVTFASTT